MTSETTTTRARTNGGSTTGSTSRGEAVQTAAAEVRGALTDMSRSVPEVARASRAAVDDMFKAIETGSDERVTAGVTLSLGLAIGMLLGGAPRLLIVLALVPVAAMGLVLQDRRRKSGSRAAATS